MERNNSERGWKFSFVSYFIGYAVGALALGLPRLHDNSDERVREAQQNNHQVFGQVNVGYDGVEDLILDDQSHSFSFRTKSGDKVEVCKGDYQVTEHAAKVVGEVACTHTEKLDK